MTIDLRRAPNREVSGARPKVERNGDPADLLKSRVVRMLLLGVVVLVIGLGLTAMLLDEASAPPPEPARNETGTTGTDKPAATDLTTYAFLLPELEGLPSSTSPGTDIEIWATWEPPVTKRPKVQRLIPRATVSKILPTIEPGPPTVVLEIERRYIPDIMFGDRFGALSVVLPSQTD